MVKCCTGERTENRPLLAGIFFQIKRRAQCWFLGHHKFLEKLTGLVIKGLWTEMILSMNCSHSCAPHIGLFLWIFAHTAEGSNKQILGSFHFLRRELEGKKYTYISVLVWINFWSASPDLPWHCGVNSQCLNCLWVFFQVNDNVLSGNKLKGWSIQLRRPDKNYFPCNMHCVGIRSSHLFSLHIFEPY